MELLNFNYSVHQTSDEVINMAHKIVEAKPDVILVLDHKPHPLLIFQALIPFLKMEDQKPRIIFHIFGDFTLFYTHWGKISGLLKDYKVDFIVASDRQKHLIDKFLPLPQSSSVCPFPVDKSEFSFNPSLRKMQRLEWGVQDDEMVFIFTGRLSLQKRIHTLLKAFSDFLTKTGTDKAHLFLYGNPDAVGDQFVGKWEVEGEYFRKINRLYKSLDPEIQKKIHFMGNVPNRELFSVYQGADMLVNLSVHNDEDFGMSVAEAQCSGLPAILTDWGGLASFYQPELKKATRFIPVKIGKKSKLIHYESVVNSLVKAFKEGHSAEREKISAKALEKFSVETASKIVAKILKAPAAPFTEFTPFFELVLERIKESGTPYITDSVTINNLYREIYSSYVRDH